MELTVMGDNLVGQMMDQAQQWLSNKYWEVFNPIYLWYAAWLAALVAAGVIATFVPFKIVRITLGIMLLFGAAYVAGGRHMGEKQRAAVNALRDQLREEKAKRKVDQAASGGGWFS